MGIISGLIINPGPVGIILLISLSAIGLLLSIPFNKRLTNTVFGISLSVTLFSSGLILYDYEKDSLSEFESIQTMFTGTLTDYPETKESSVLLTVKLSNQVRNGQVQPVKGSIVLYHRSESNLELLKPGDIIRFRCIPIPIVNRGNPYEFDYRFYMESRGIRYYAFTSRQDLISFISPEKRKLKFTALMIRKKIIGMYEKRGITGKRLALASAITLGEKEKLDPDQKEDFIRAGVMHIMAVSGLHAMILSLFIFNLLFFLKRRFNILRVVITIIFLWVFAFITGLTPSVLRATLMFTFLQTGNLLKRRVNGVNSILASAFILIIIRPSVIFDAGFLLSYSAVLFIIGFYKEFHNLVTFRNRVCDFVWQSVAVTIVAQAGTLPLTIMLFNRFPTLFIITNTVIVPLSSVVVITGCLIPFLYPMVHISGMIAFVLDKLTGFTEYLTSKAAEVPWSTIENIGLSLPECIALSIFIPLIFTFLIRKPGIKAIYPLVALLLFVLTSVSKNVTTGSVNELIVYNTPGYATIGIKSGRSLLVFSENPEIPREVRRHSSVLGLRTEKRMLTDSALLIQAGSRKILIYDNPLKGEEIMDKADIFIVKGKSPIHLNDLPVKDHLRQKRIILAVSGTNIIKGNNYINNDNPVWSVKNSGAFRLGL